MQTTRDDAHFCGGTGSPLVLLHGLGASYRVWRPVIPLLTPHFNVLALTLPGHFGVPDLAKGARANADGLTSWIGEQLDRRGIKTAHVVGNSLGGWLALELARRGRAKSVVALATVGLLEQAEIAHLRKLIKANYWTASRLGNAGNILARFGLGRRLLFGSVVHNASALSTDTASEWFHAFAACKSYLSMADDFETEPPAPLPQKLPCPVHFVWPTRDKMNPGACEDRFARALPDATHVQIHKAGHIPMSDAPDEIAQIVLAHTRRATQAETTLLEARP